MDRGMAIRFFSPGAIGAGVTENVKAPGIATATVLLMDSRQSSQRPAVDTNRTCGFREDKTISTCG